MLPILRNKGFNMKRFSYIFILLLVSIGSGIAEENTTFNVRNNWISSETSLLGGGIKYEHMLGSKVSIGANIYYITLIAFDDFGTDFSVHYYPQAKTFFTSISLGYHEHIHKNTNDIENMEKAFGVAITPGVGWKIDVAKIGNAGGLFIQPGIKIPLSLGMYDNEFKFGIGIVPFFGLGFSF